MATGVRVPATPPPSHPIPQLQGPFEESIAEVSPDVAAQWIVQVDAQTRRRDLLENDEYERLCGRKWRQRASEKYHPLWKLVSQMVFGVHLLARQQAKSPVTVMRILQGHVDEMDGFLQRTTEDFLIIHLDVRTRIQYLSLPLGNLAVFDEMLDDRHFRLALISYNDQIEHAVERFTLAIIDALKDLHKGKEAVAIFSHYLQEITNDGCFEADNLRTFARTMLENMDGWIGTLAKLHRQGQALQQALGQLAFTIMEMQRRVGVASRKELRSRINANGSMSTRSKSVRRKLFSRGSGPGTPGRKSSDKPLPVDPLTELDARPASRWDDRFSVHPGQINSPGSYPSRAHSTTPQVLNRARSCTALAGDVSSSTGGPRPPSRSASRLSRAFSFSRPFLSKRTFDDPPSNVAANTSTNATINLDHRPSTAPGLQTIHQPPSTSFDRPKSRWMPSRPRTQQSIRPARSASVAATSAPAMASPSPLRQQQTAGHAQPPLREPLRHDGEPVANVENMKDQISHFLKTDRVVEAWDNIAKTANCCGASLAKTKQWPSSVFRAKSPSASEARTETTPAAAADHDGSLSWTQLPEPQLNTFSFKRRPSASPRIHVLSIAIDEDASMSMERASDAGSHAETGSSITALPAVPAPRLRTPRF
ncbi:hypothetical protein PDE_06211 [Penicillium oxalicum 114-2]|uniref:Uncharacterized protein n=1 Tax=Penicillium oxalicum (strain 114-2 / CGMCC 5302) TaxID=933388 RepID=S7ZRH3_PENO1|nr:hypothetical protein PDE_06211 [Penicillium oxalicum 114-2]